MNREPHTQDIQKARKNYDRLAGVYDWLASSEGKFTRQGITWLTSGLPGSILEIGCGTGKGLIELQDQCAGSAKITGIDLSGKMCLRAKQRLPQSNPSLVNGSALALPFCSATFNAILISFTYELFPAQDRALLLQEIWRTLQTQGKLALVSLYQPGKPSLSVKLYEAAHRWLPGLVDCRPICAGAELVQAGFRVLRRQIAPLWGLPVESLLAQKL